MPQWGSNKTLFFFTDVANNTCTGVYLSLHLLSMYVCMHVCMYVCCYALIPNHQLKKNQYACACIRKKYTKSHCISTHTKKQADHDTLLQYELFLRLRDYKPSALIISLKRTNMSVYSDAGHTLSVHKKKTRWPRNPFPVRAIPATERLQALSFNLRSRFETI